MLTIENVSKKFKGFTALADINTEFAEGIYVILSPNGAGKTTLLKIMATLLFPTTGTVYYNGTDIRQMGEQYRELIGYMPQHFGYYRDYSAERYLKYIEVLKGIGKSEAAERTDALLDRLGLFEVKSKKLKTYSGGMLQRVGIAQALLNNPEILILDEPTAGLDPMERAKFRDILVELAEGKTILYSTHIVSDVEDIADRIIMLKNHTLHCNMTVDELRNTFLQDGKAVTLEQAFIKTYQ